MVPANYTIQEYPSGGWVVVIEGHSVPVLYDSRAEAEDAARWLLGKHTGFEKPSAFRLEHESVASA